MCKTNYLLLKGGGAYNPLSSTEGALNALEPSGPQEKKEKRPVFTLPQQRKTPKYKLN